MPSGAMAPMAPVALIGSILPDAFSATAWIFWISATYSPDLPFSAAIWNSRGAGPRAEGTTGLAGIRLLAAPAAFRRLEARLSRNGDGLLEVRDPWGTRLVFEEK